MIELSSQQQKEQQLPPRAVQIISHPFFGRVVLTAGPAQFGLDLSKHKEVWAPIIYAVEIELKMFFKYYLVSYSLFQFSISNLF